MLKKDIIVNNTSKVLSVNKYSYLHATWFFHAISDVKKVYSFKKDRYISSYIENWKHLGCVKVIGGWVGLKAYFRSSLKCHWDEIISMEDF